MKIKLGFFSVIGVVAATFPAIAQQGSVGNIDAYYIPSADYEQSLGNLILKDDGDGFGFRGKALFSEQLFFSGEYQSTDYDDSNLELDLLRVGVGFVSALSPAAKFLGQVEYIKADLEIPGLGSDDENGFGVHIGAVAEVAPQFSVTGQLGYLSVGDFSGPEFLVGARFQASPVVSVFLDYRLTRLSDSGEDLDLDDLRMGIGFHF